MSIEQEPLVKTVIVPTTPDRAFRLFTAELGKWWPLVSHSVRGDQATDVRLEGAVGGQIIEYDAAGPVGSWGTVSDWDPPHTVSFSWHPGSDPQEADQVTVRFIPTDESTGSGGGPDGSGSSTLVELTHTGWERRPDGGRARENYDSGWTYVLGHFVQFRP
ncbi:SRPBCC domain-containing protein [Kribbella sp. DT2]|uniref:SRPBCC domain-containing protein n=1 Tax=Kribbella sp. DT2 TaxID=3393427 RepID=UPI003CF35588